MHPHCRNLARFGALLLSTLLALAGCGGGGGGSSGGGDTPPTSSTPWALQATDAAALTTYLRGALGPSSAWLSGPGGVPVPASAGSAGDTFSGTTLQEPGVDEDDLIESDGAFVWSLDHAATSWQRATLRRQQMNAAAAALTPVDSLVLPFSTDVGGSGLYLDGDRRQLVALGSGFVSMVTGISPAAMWFAPPSYWGQGVTEAVFVSAPAGSAMRVTRRLHITASLIGSRRVGSTLYLVLRSYPSLPGFDPSWQPANTAANNALLAALQPQQAFPTIAVDGGAPQPLVDASSCLMQSQNAGATADIVAVLGVDLATGERGARCFIGRTEAFYMSPANLYLATTRSSYDTSGASPVYQPQTSTDIHKFALDGVAMTYRGSGNVPGHLGFNQGAKSFRFGEWQEALRVVTQTQTAGFVGTTAGTPTSTASPAQLTILQDRNGTLVTVGQLPNAARPDAIGKPGELLYASRFVGARGYIVTYRLIDPLYVLDLSNPADPKIAGQLQVPGYSDYLFPLSDTLLLGVGKDAIADGTAGDGRFAWYQGVKVSLIDVSDPAHPLEAARQVIGHRGSQATVLWDHHGVAIQQAGTSARIGLPVDVHDTPPAVLTGKPNDYWSYTRTELQRFEVDLGARTLTRRPALATSVTTPGERSIASDRSLLWHDQVHWYQDGIWASGAW